jgi:capsular polysaccharide export protein
MLNKGLEGFGGRRVLLLQGPVGPFFARLAQDLRAIGAEVHKVNFNAGDWLFYPRDAINYRGTMKDWPRWVKQLLVDLRIDVVFLFGDCRPIHQAAHAAATALGIDVGVFEEGYVRPDYVTLERHGVNGYSRMPRTPEMYGPMAAALANPHPVGNAYWAMVRCGFLYWTIGGFGRPFFPHYVHHRPLTLLEAGPWVRSAWRKQWYKWKERGLEQRLTTEYSRRFYLAPLQVFNDAQVTVHADGLDGVEHFIESTLSSFACHAPQDTLLVFKHHPMDRGYRDYTRLIRASARQAGVADRVLYIHDQHLPSLLDHARGVVLVNSTVGMSALHHGAPTIVRGRALYDMPGLTYRGSLDEFWVEAPEHRPDRRLYQSFRSRLISDTQINGSFYRALPQPGTKTGLAFGGAPLQPAIPVVATGWSARAAGDLARIDVRSRPAPLVLRTDTSAANSILDEDDDAAVRAA